MSVATALARARFWSTSTISRMRARDAAAMATAEPTAPTPMMPSFMIDGASARGNRRTSRRRAPARPATGSRSSRRHCRARGRSSRSMKSMVVSPLVFANGRRQMLDAGLGEGGVELGDVACDQRLELRHFAVDLGHDLARHRLGLAGRRPVGRRRHGDHVHQRVVEAGRVAQHVAHRLALRVDHDALDGRELVDDRGGGALQRLVGLRRAPGDLGQLALGAAQAVDRGLELGERGHDVAVQGELRLVLGLRRGQARILDHRELRRLRLAADGEIDAVAAGHDGRAGRIVGVRRQRLGPGRREIVVELGGAGIFQVPDEAVQPRLLARPARRRQRLVVAGERRDLAAAQIAEGERERPLGLLGEPVVDDRAVGRVLADIEMLAIARAVGALDHHRAAVDAEGRAVGDAGAHIGAGAPMQLGADGGARREQACRAFAPFASRAAPRRRRGSRTSGRAWPPPGRCP